MQGRRSIYSKSIAKCKHIEKEKILTITKVVVIKPRESDVICGKSRTSHPGNQQFTNIIELHREKYHVATEKRYRMDITKEIYSSFGRSSSRFLRFRTNRSSNKDDKQYWEELTEVEARDKISHALRFANRRIEKKKDSGYNSAGNEKKRKKAKLNHNHKRKRFAGCDSINSISDSKHKNSDSSVMNSCIQIFPDELPIWNHYVNRQQKILKVIKKYYTCCRHSADGKYDTFPPENISAYDEQILNSLKDISIKPIR